MRTFVLLVGVLSLSSVAVAQDTTSEIIELNKQAMDAYGMLEIDKALDLLNQAEEKASAAGVGGMTVARIHLNRGMVQAGGMGDNAAAMTSFKKALCYDSAVMLDPLNSTPDMNVIFTGAKNQATPDECATLIDAAGGGDASTTSPSVTDGGGGASSGPPEMIATDVLRHTPVVEQEKLVPIPFFVQTNPQQPVGSVVLYYKTTGERIFQQLKMTQKGGGWAAHVGCNTLTTLDPSQIEYYIAVYDSEEQLLGNAGSEADPFVIDIVDSVTYLPTPIPNESPLPACQKECPPWDPNCNEACQGYADFCSDTEPCCDGLACVGGVCDEAAECDGDECDGDMTAQGKRADHKVRLWLSGGSGMGIVPGRTYTRDDFPNMTHEGTVEVGSAGISWSKIHMRVGALFALPVPKLEVGISSRLGLPLADPNAGYKTLIPSVMANVAYSVVGDSPVKGVEMIGMFGFGWMRIPHRIPFDDCYSVNESNRCMYDDWAERGDVIDPRKSGFRTSGFLGAELGLDIYYWINKNFGVNVISAMVDVTFPDFAVHVDASAGVGFRF